MNKFIYGVLAIGLILRSSPGSYAQFQDMNWIGGTGVWDDPSNWDTGAIPTINEIAQIPPSNGDTVYVSDGVIARAKGLYIKPGSSLVLVGNGSHLEIVESLLQNEGYIRNNGLIEISISAYFINYSLINYYGTIDNHNTIRISNGGQGERGLNNFWESKFTNHVGATLFIDGTRATGLNNAGQFYNNGSIDVRSNSEFFSLISNSNTYYNVLDTFYVGEFINTGDIILFDNKSGGFGSGISNSGVFENQGGTIEMDSIKGIGISNRLFNAEYPSTFRNSGVIDMGSGILSDSLGTTFGAIDNLLATFINEESGTITIDSLSFINSNPEKRGVKNYANSTFINHGTIEMSFIKYGIDNAGSLINEGTIASRFMAWGHLNNTGEGALFNNSGTFMAEGATVSFVGLSNVNQAQSNNDGEIITKGLGAASFVGAIFNDATSTFTSGNKIYTDRGISNLGTFDIIAGTVEIDSFRVENKGVDASFSNSGDMQIKEHRSSIENIEGAAFSNIGSIDIRNTNGTFGGAIRHEGQNSLFTNSGNIFIDSVGTQGNFFSNGIAVKDSAVFENTGQITIERTGYAGIYLQFDDGFFYNSGSIDLNGSFFNSGIFITSSEFRNQSGGVINIDSVGVAGITSGGDLVNETDATINISSGGTYQWPTAFGGGIYFSGGRIDNQGTINIEGNIRGAAIQARSTNDTIVNAAGGEINIIQATTHGVAFDRGKFYNAGKITFGAQILNKAIYRDRDEEFFANLSSGEVWGVGTIDTGVFINQGRILPGFSPGIITIEDSYDHTEAIYELEIAGNGGPGAPDGHDLIVVEDTLFLGGICNIALINDFTPAMGDSYVIMTCGTRLGTFDSVNFALDTALWEIEYRPTEVVLNFINAPPEFVSTPVDTAYEDQLYTYNIEATDPNPDDPLEIEAVDIPSWLTITDNGDGTAVLSGIPSNDHIGDTTVTLIVTDDAGLTDTQVFTIVILNTNDPPFFTSTPDTIAAENEQYEYEIAYNDVDPGDSLTIEVVGLPAGAQFIVVADERRAVLRTFPGSLEPGLYEIVLIVTDSAGATAEQRFTLVIQNVNEPPVFTSTPVATATEDVLYTYTIETSDPDAGDQLAISSAGLPDWLVLTDNGDGTAVLSGTPANEDVGVVAITLLVTDSAGLFIDQAFELEVLNTNDPPQFTSGPVTVAAEGTAYVYNIVVVDPDTGDTPAITATTLPDWLNLTDNGDGTATLNGTPNNADVGPHDVVLVATDDSLATDEQSFTIQVTNTNEAPAFTSQAVTSAEEDALYSYSVTTEDPDIGDTRAITAEDLPAWLELIDNGDGTATLSGTPANEDVGPVEIVLVVTDAGGLFTRQTFTINVVNTNDPPVFTSAPIVTAAEAVLYTYNITTSDPDVGDTRTITPTTVPAWLTFADNGDGTAVLTGTPGSGDVGPHNVVLLVTDAAGASVEQTFTIEVGGINDPPVFTSAPVTDAVEDAVYLYEIAASDPDVGDVLKITAVALPGWLTLTDNGDGTATLTGTPLNANVGTVQVTLRVRDGAGVTANQTFTITVVNTNDPPVITSQPITAATVGVQYTYSFVSTDPDVADVLTIQVDGLPSWLIFTNQSNGKGNLSGLPTVANEGSYTITFTVTDASGASVQQTFTIQVAGANKSPSITSAPVGTAVVGVLYTYNIVVSDPNPADQVAITTENLPGWLTLVDNGNRTAVLSGTPGVGDLGNVTVTITATDSKGAKNSQTFIITVVEAGNPPAFTSSAVTTGRENELYSYTVTVTDPDGISGLKITATQIPAWLTLADNGNGAATLSGTPAGADVGSHAVVLVVTDPTGLTAEQAFDIVVDPAEVENRAPVLSNVAATVDEDDVLAINLSDFLGGYTDADGDPLVVVRIVNQPQNGMLQLNGTPLNTPLEIGANNIAGLVYIPNADYFGPDQFSWNAGDGEAFAQSNAAFNIDVLPVNDDPLELNLSNNQVEEGLQAGAVVGTLTVVDNDPGDQHVFAFSPNNTVDADAFTIDGNVLRTSIVLDYDVQNQYVIRITADDGNGGSITREFVIKVLNAGEEFFQTGITPNGDGINDTWKINGLANCADCLVEVYNRWGQRVFSSTGYEQEWDGTYNNELLPAGTYYYVVDFKNGKPASKGAITIMK